MDIKLKHRLVGACVILALAVFFLPMILDSEKYSHEINSQIPENSVLEGSSDETEAQQQGSLTINLDEEEPEKAITTNEKPDSTAAESKNAESKASKSTVSDQDEQQPSESETKPEAESAPELENDSQETVADKAKSESAAANQTESSNTQTSSEQESKKQAQTETTEKKVDTPEKKAPQEDENKASSTAQPDSKPQFEQNAWVIQIGSFSNKENATTLVSELRTKGYRAYLRQSGEYSRVFVGPYPDKDAAESRTEGLAKIVGSAVKVIEFDPQSH